MQAARQTATDNMPRDGAKITDLRSALEAFRPQGPEFGGSEIDASRLEVELVRFRRNLAAVSASNKAHFWICVALQLILFSGACYLVAHFIDQPKGAAAVFSITGVSFARITTQMAGLWKKKVSSDMLLVLAGQLKQEDLKGITDVLLREYFK